MKGSVPKMPKSCLGPDGFSLGSKIIIERLAFDSLPAAGNRNFRTKYAILAETPALAGPRF
jgi:hypothetical protein